MKNSLLHLAALLFVAGVVGLNAQTNQPKSQDSQPPTTDQTSEAKPSHPMRSQEARPFNGTIEKEKGRLVLKDSTTNLSYRLDDQEKAKQFEGKPVKVTGKLAGKTIHVENIEPGGGT